MAKVGNYNGSRTPTAKAEKIVSLLAAGEPLSRIAQECHCSRHMAYALREERAADIAQRKEAIRASAGRSAAVAFDMINERLDRDGDKIPLNMLIPIAGVGADKFALLSPPPDQNLNVSVTHEPSERAYEAFNRLAEAMKGSKGVQSSATQTPALPPIQQDEVVIDVEASNIPPLCVNTGPVSRPEPEQ